MTIPADVFPLSAVGTVSGLVGFGGSIGGAIFGLVAGRYARAWISVMERYFFSSAHFI